MGLRHREDRRKNYLCVLVSASSAAPTRRYHEALHMAISRSFGVCAQLRRHARLAREDATQCRKQRRGETPAKITLEGLRDMVALGLGAPNLGTFRGVDKDTGAMKFELDENRS